MQPQHELNCASWNLSCFCCTILLISCQWCIRQALTLDQRPFQKQTVCQTVECNTPGLWYRAPVLDSQHCATEYKSVKALKRSILVHLLRSPQLCMRLTAWVFGMFCSQKRCFGCSGKLSTLSSYKVQKEKKKSNMHIKYEAGRFTKQSNMS